MTEVGAWNSFQEIEDLLTLDELMLLNEAMGKKLRDNLKMLCMVQGIDVSDWDEDDLDSDDDSDLPEELLKAERELAERKAEKGEAGDFSEFGLGYSRT